jgi:hypothetical protein
VYVCVCELTQALGVLLCRGLDAGF